jgi:hypothetical protein
MRATLSLPVAFEKPTGAHAPVAAIALSGDGAQSLVGDLSGGVWLYDTAAGTMVRAIRRPAAGYPLVRNDQPPWVGVLSVAFITGGRVAIAFADGGAVLLEAGVDSLIARGEAVTSGAPHTAEIADGVAGPIAVFGDRAGVLHLVELESGKDGGSLTVAGLNTTSHGNPALSVAVSVDGKRAAFGDGRPALHIFDVEAHARLLELSTLGSPPTVMTFTQDAGHLLFGTARGEVESVDVRTGSVDWSSPPTNQAVAAIAVSEDGHLLATGDPNGVVTLWMPSTGARVATVPAVGTGAITALAISPDASRFVVSTASGDVRSYGVTLR